MEYQSWKLPNGIRLVHKHTSSPVAYCGLLIQTGSRDEEEHEHGLAHFIEHVLFKGTHKRKAYHILSRLEDVGGEINAYTTKEETCIHASFLHEYYERALELIGDIVFHSSFPPKEMEKEKEVIIDEINSYNDNPSELIFDDFEELIFPNAAIGRNILGSEKTIRTFTKDEITRFMKANYHTNNMVFSSVGNISFERLVRLFEKYFSNVPANFGQKSWAKFDAYTPVNKTENKQTFHSHCIIGNVTYDIFDPRRVGMYLLNNILGGQGLNSRLNLSLREKRGYTYNVEASYHPYFDTGIMSIYFGSDKENLYKSIDLAHKEIRKMQKIKMGILQLSRAKKQIMGQLAISSDNNESLMLSLAKSILIFDKFESMEETYQKIEAVTASELLDMANEVLKIDQLSTLIYL
ncbi:MAG: insulinase family protein [Bacteroidales bacterium]|nr:insulinase family protein [Bacteroidales bacterium]